MTPMDFKAIRALILAIAIEAQTQGWGSAGNYAPFNSPPHSAGSPGGMRLPAALLSRAFSLARTARVG